MGNRKSSKNSKKVAKKIKSKVPKKVRKWITFIALVSVAVFVLVCYFNPSFYQKVLNFIYGEDDNRSLIVDIKGDTATVDVLYDLEVHFIDVGQGDCIFFLLPDGKSVLIDSGDQTSYEVGSYSYKMVEFIKNRLPNNSKVIDYVIATHTDSDHIGGMKAIFDNFEVKKVFRSYVKYTGDHFVFDDEFNQGSTKTNTRTKVYGTFLNLIKNERYGNNIPCEYEFFNYQSDFGMNIECNGVKTKYTFDFLTPTKSVNNISYDNPNDYSPYVKFDYQGFTIMLTGDAEEEVINELLSCYKDDLNYLDVDLLKVGHHGSSNATSSELIKALTPKYAVIQYGKDNKYGHPHVETTSLLDGAGVIYNRDCGKNIMISINSLGQESAFSYPSA